MANKFEMFRGETKGFKLEIKNEVDGSAVNVAFVHGHHNIKKSFSTKDGSLYKDDDGYYKFELSATDSEEMGVSTFAIEVEVESPAGSVVRPVGELEIKKDQVYKL